MELFDMEKARFTENQMLLDFGMKHDAAATADLWRSTKECDHGRNLSNNSDQLAGKAARMDYFGRLKIESHQECFNGRKSHHWDVGDSGQSRMGCFVQGQAAI